MWMIAATGGLTAQVDWLGLRVGGHLALTLLSSNELGELLQWRYRRGIIIILIIRKFSQSVYFSAN